MSVLGAVTVLGISLPHKRWPGFSLSSSLGHGRLFSSPLQRHELIAHTPSIRSIFFTALAMAEGEQYSHPMISFFSVVFKFSAIGFYILCSLVIHNFVIQFVITILLVALDFWTVKNVSGRLLVGLRWWNDINEEGESVWHFESLDQQSLETLSKKDSWLFWWSLYLSPVIWLGLGLIAIVKFNFDYLLVVVVALVLNIANIIGFTRCQKDAKKQIEDFARQTVGSRVASSLQSVFSV